MIEFFLAQLWYCYARRTPANNMKLPPEDPDSPDPEAKDPEAPGGETISDVTRAESDELALRDVLAQGYAVSNEEWEPGLRSLAAPVFTRDGRVVAAVCVTVVRPGVSTHMMERDFLPGLLQTAEGISSELGYRDQQGISVVCPPPS